MFTEAACNGVSGKGLPAVPQTTVLYLGRAQGRARSITNEGELLVAVRLWAVGAGLGLEVRRTGPACQPSSESRSLAYHTMRPCLAVPSIAPPPLFPPPTFPRLSWTLMKTACLPRALQFVRLLSCWVRTVVPSPTRCSYSPGLAWWRLALPQVCVVVLCMCVCCASARGISFRWCKEQRV